MHPITRNGFSDIPLQAAEVQKSVHGMGTSLTKKVTKLLGGEKLENNPGIEYIM